MPKTETRPAVFAGIVVMLFLFVGVGSWASTAHLSGAIIASGTIAIKGKPKTIQHLDGGIVSKLLVTNGDLVEKGQLLVRLDSVSLEANRKIYSTRLLDSLATRARLIAERDHMHEFILDETILSQLNIQPDNAVLESQKKLFNARAASRQGQVDQLREKKEQFKHQTSGNVALKQSKTRQYDLLKREFKGVDKLFKKGFAPVTKTLALERQLEEILGQIAEYDSDLARIKNSISETNIQILQIEREFRREVLSELQTTQTAISDTTQQIYATLQQLKRVDILAPVSGIIHELNIFTVGGVIGPGAAILQIIPQDDNLVIEANVEPQFIDELTIGQKATIRFSAFNQRNTPEIEGYIKTISPNSIVHEQTGIPFYRIILMVSDNEITKLEGIKLIPGMPAETFIKTGDRTPLNYLLKPLMDQIRRAFREE
ncbi:MAG: HlyD family type I secretion periplasmic adaptor subunit [Hyphomicrobiales bacterium]|nr:HlyD family type I secretion periplasmic adaptor subunit [Hyphomicrobiales bacterium]